MVIHLKLNRFVFLLVMLLSCTLFADNFRPCQLVGVDEIAKHAIPILGTMSSTGISSDDRENEMALLKKCIKKYAVCIVEAPPKNTTWLSEKLIEPANNKHFDPVHSDLVFGVLQYVEKKTGDQICMVARNSRANAVPWLGGSWVISGQTIRQYQFWDDQFTTAMTPKSLYQALIKSHEEAVRDNQLVNTYLVSKSN